MEALAALVDQQVIHLDVIDDLFSYRFFLAVNNPVVQQDELFPYSDYYKGIFKLCEKWTNNHRKKNIAIPMDQFNLSERVNAWTKDTIMIPLDISVARGDDKKYQIAKCLYYTDRYIYPEAFGEDEKSASTAIGRIIGMDDSLLDYKNLIVARYNGQVCGVCLIFDGTGRWDKEKVLKRVGKEYLPDRLMEGFEHASDKYFSEFYNNRDTLDGIEIIAFSVDEGFRRKHIGSALMNEVIKQYGKNTITLTVLANNRAAINLYEKKGFKIEGEPFKGFAPLGLTKPDCYTMVRTCHAIE